jgi:hypothetical protein
MIGAMYSSEIIFACLVVHFLPTDNRGIQTRAGALFTLICEQLFISITTIALSCNIYIVPVEKQVFFKEEASGFYSISAYLAAKNLSLLPQQIIFPLIMSCITYWVVGFNPQVDKFIIYGKINAVFFIILCNITGGGLGLLVGTIFPTPLVAQPAGSLMSIPLSLFAGMYVSIDNITKPFDLIQYISVKYT